MNCAHVLGLIDAGPLADYPAAEIDAAWRHARACATCGPALEAATALTAGLAALPQPAPPATLAAEVLARIARIEDIDEAHDVRVAASKPEARVASMSRDWWSQAAALGGLAAGVALVLSNGGASTDFTSLRTGGMTAAMVSMPAAPSLALVLAAGVVLYAAGLFAPAGGSRRA